MRLDTGIRQTASQGLYQSLGFRRIKAYYELPRKLEDYLVFMELNLQS
jgi:ribosomal protein S18 acetylase RimI-like enzyme